MSQILRANYADLYGSSMLPALEELFKHELSLHPSIRDQLFNKKQAKNGIWQASEVTDLQNFLEIPEGTDYSLVKPRSGANKTISVKKYGLGFSISEEAVEDGKFDMIAQCIRALAESAMDTREQSAMDVFNNAFGSQNAWDGQDLCSTSHVVPSGLTFRNRPSTDVDLSPSALRDAITDFETQFIRDSGKYANLRPRVLLVHSSQRAYAQELIGSDLKPDSADNNMNMLRGEGLIVLSSPRLADTDAWFLVGKPSDTGLIIASSKDIETKAAGPDLGFMNDSIIYKSRYREMVDVTHPYAIWGTTGA